MKSNLNRVLNQVLDDVPRALLEKLIARKFAQAGAQPSGDAIRQLAGRLIAGKTSAGTRMGLPMSQSHSRIQTSRR